MGTRSLRQTLTGLRHTVLPTGIQRYLHRRRLRRRHGLVDLGPDPGLQIADNVRFGVNCRVSSPVYIAGSTIGDYTYIETGCRISAAEVGRFCSIAPYALVGLAEHPTGDFVSTHPMFYRRLPEFGYDAVHEGSHQELRTTTIGHDVWIGAGACVKGGVSIGHGAVIGAGAVVTRDVPPFAVCGGVPARVLRYRFDEATIAWLLDVAWWERDIAWIKARASDMQDVQGFREFLGSLPESEPGQDPGL